jgi:K+-transporting ATPase KdpF subunit
MSAGTNTGGAYGRHNILHFNAGVFRGGLGLHDRLLQDVGRDSYMEYTIGMIMSILLGIYLVYALLRPERF